MLIYIIRDLDNPVIEEIEWTEDDSPDGYFEVWSYDKWDLQWFDSSLL